MACTINKPFGYEQKITNWSFTNNPIPLAQLDNIHTKTYAYGQTRGSLGLEFVLSSPFWLRNIFGAPCETAAMCCCPVLESYCINCACHEYDMPSFTVEIGQENACSDIVRRLSGAVINNASVRSTVGDVARTTLDISYASEANACVSIDACPAAVSVCCDIPYTFAHGTLQTIETCGACAVTIAEVQDIDFTLNTNAELLYQHGCNTAVDAYRRLFELTGSFRTSWVCTARLVNVYEQTQHDCQSFDREQHQLKISFDNGLSGTSDRELIFTFTGISIRSHDLSIEPNEPVFETIPWQARTVSVSAKTGSAEP